MSIGNKHVSHYKYFKAPLQKKRISDGVVRMPNATAEEIFQMQKIDIKTLESNITDLEKQIKELKLENKNLRKANTLQEKELRKNHENSTGIPSLMQSYKEDIRAIQSKVSSLQEQLKISENNLKMQEKAVIRKHQEIEKLITAKRQNERLIKEVNMENKELRSEKERVDKEFKELFKLNEKLKLKNEELQQNVEQMTSKVSQLEESLGSAEILKAQLEEDLNKLQINYNKLEQKLSVQKQSTETQTDDMDSKNNLHFSFNAGSKSYFKISEVNSEDLKASGDYWVDEYINVEEKQRENTIKSSDNICETKFSGLHPHQHGQLSSLPEPNLQKPLLKPMKSRTLYPLKTNSNALGLIPIDFTYSLKPFASINGLSVSSNFLQSDCAKNVQSLKYFS